MKKIALFFLGVSVSFIAAAQVETKSVIGMGGNFESHSVSSPTDSCFYSICVAGEMAVSSSFSVGVFTGNIGFVHPDEDTLQVICLDDETKDISENIASIKVFPNPNNGAFTLSINAPKSGVEQITIVDVLGRKFETRMVNSRFGLNDYYFSKIPLGLYFINVETIGVLKLVVE